MLAVGVQARIERAVRRAHFALHPSGDAAGDVGMTAPAGVPGEVGIQREQRPVVVEHLLEMRNRPERVDAVAREPAAKLIVDAAVGHARERDLDHVERVRVIGANRFPQAQLQFRRVRKLRRSAESAPLGIEALLQLGERGGGCGGRQCLRGSRVGLEARERIDEPRVLLRDLGAALAMRRRDAREEVAKSGQAEAALLGKIRAAEKGLAGRRQEHRERPAAGTLREQRVRRLVNLVEVGPLLAVDLDVDE